MKGTTVEKSDLIGEIKEFPIEVAQEMVNEQVRQGNKAAVEVFQEDYSADKNCGGFCWCDSVMGADFWYEVLFNKRFDEFFQEYPKDKNKHISKVMKKEEKKTEKKVVVSKEKYDRLVAENDKLIAENDKLVAENDKLEFNNSNLEKTLCNNNDALIKLSRELLRLKNLIENHNKRLFSRKIKF